MAGRKDPKKNIQRRDLCSLSFLLSIIIGFVFTPMSSLPAIPVWQQRGGCFMFLEIVANAKRGGTLEVVQRSTNGRAAARLQLGVCVAFP